MIQKQFIYVGFWPRLLAHNIDVIPLLILMYVSNYILPEKGYDWITFSLIYLSYHIGFELSGWRATPGKKLLHIRISGENGSTLQFHQSLIRNVTKSLSLLLFFGGFIAIIFNPKRKGLHDHLAGTVVYFDNQ